MKALDLIESARHLATCTGKPRQSNLLRAISTSYYALFHTLARSCADLLIGGPSAARSKDAWHQVYRALEHGACKNACKNGKVGAFPQEIQDFANLFITMQEKRHTADYDPNAKAYKSAVLLDLGQVESVMKGFVTAPLKDRRAFAAFVLFKLR